MPVSGRAVVSAVCLGLVVYAASSLRATPALLLTCCNDETDCGGIVCCDNVSLGMVACDPSMPGICMDYCHQLSGS